MIFKHIKIYKNENSERITAETIHGKKKRE